MQGGAQGDLEHDGPTTSANTLQRMNAASLTQLDDQHNNTSDDNNNDHNTSPNNKHANNGNNNVVTLKTTTETTTLAVISIVRIAIGRGNKFQASTPTD